MKTRIISAAVGIVLLLAVLLCPYTVVLAVLLAAIAALAVWELLHATGRVKEPLLLYGSMAFAAAGVLAQYAAQATAGLYPAEAQTAFSPYHVLAVLPLLLVLLYGVFLVLVLLRHHAGTDVSTVGYAAFLTLYATAGFASLAAIRVMQHGLLFLLVVLLIPWMSDTGAYFVGTFFGKHKMTPVISPKKSWEGFFGGWAVAIGSAVLAGVIYHAATGAPGHCLLLAVLAFVLAPLSVCGDLFASVIKRQSGIKDYGRIMPGHGGVMDRFDSVVVIAPLLYMLLELVV